MIIRAVEDSDCGAIAELINEIIRDGRYTSMTEELTEARVRKYYASPEVVSVVVAEVDGEVIGVQELERCGESRASIATFVRLDRRRGGVGRSLFTATRDTIANLETLQVDAVVRSDNPSACVYYEAMGFVEGRSAEGAQRIFSWRSSSSAGSDR